MSTTTRAEQLATQFDELNDEIAAAVTGCGDEEWLRTTASEGWTIAAVAHHIAIVQRAFAGMVAKLAAGETYTPAISMEEIHRSNAEHAREYAEADGQETFDILESSRAEILRSLHGLDDEQLDRVAGVFGGRELSVNQVLKLVVIGHAREHFKSIRATIAA